MVKVDQGILVHVWCPVALRLHSVDPLVLFVRPVRFVQLALAPANDRGVLGGALRVVVCDVGVVVWLDV